MAISTGYGKRIGEQKAASKRVAESYRRAQKKSKKRGFFSKMLGGVGGKLLTSALSSALGVASGGLLMPLIMAGSNMLAKKASFELTREMAPKARDITGGGKYGYGEEEAKTLREGLIQQQESLDPTKGQGTFGKELLSSYISAGMQGDLGNVGKALKGKGTEGLLMGTSIGEGGKEVIGTGKGLLQFGDVGQETGFTIDDVTGEAIPIPKEGFKMGSLKDVGTEFMSGAGEAVGLGSTWKQGEEDVDEEDFSLGDIGQSYEEMEQGGIVQAKPATIADYFGMQGKSLGGSNKHSLAEMLGRI